MDDCNETLRNLYRREFEKITEQQASPDDPLKAAQVENLRARTKLTDHEIAQSESELMPVAGHIEQMSALRAYFAQFLETLPETLRQAASLDPAQMAELDRTVSHVRAELYKDALQIVRP